MSIVVTDTSQAEPRAAASNGTATVPHSHARNTPAAGTQYNTSDTPAEHTQDLTMTTSTAQDPMTLQQVMKAAVERYMNMPGSRRESRETLYGLLSMSPSEAAAERRRQLLDGARIKQPRRRPSEVDPERRRAVIDKMVDKMFSKTTSPSGVDAKVTVANASTSSEYGL
jgi:hypothetical protein